MHYLIIFYAPFAPQSKNWLGNLPIKNQKQNSKNWVGNLPIKNQNFLTLEGCPPYFRSFAKLDRF